ncbi:MAG: hypothetical protein LAT67_11700 [Balneolales bacterium]|nr:hypothetical protein [Balneolales bacterium]
MAAALTEESFGQDVGLSGSSTFRRQLDSFSWNYSTAFEREAGWYRIEARNIFNSRFFLLDGSPQNIQDENIAVLSTSAAVADPFFLSIEARSVRLTSTSLRQDQAAAGLSWVPGEVGSLTALTGILVDERSSIRDQGLLLGLRGELNPYSFGELMLQHQLHIDYGDIQPRTFQNWRFLTQSLLDTEDFRMESEFNLSRNVRDSYQASSFFNREQTDFFESVQSDTTAIYTTAYFPIAGFLSSRIDFSGLVQTRTVRNIRLNEEFTDELFNTRISRQQFDLRFETVYEDPSPNSQTRLSAGFIYGIGTRDSELLNRSTLSIDQQRRRTDILQNSNFEQRRLELFTLNRIQTGENNLSTVSGRLSIFNYDTPQLNRDDRDELYFQILLGNRHQFRDDFWMQFTLAGEATHTVYLFSERSIENNWRRSVRFSPEFGWEPANWIQTRHRFLIRANYTVDDFELPGRPRNDQASREFLAESGADFRIDSEWSAGISLSRSELRIGRLNWEEFREIPTDTLITWDSRAQITHRSGNVLTSVGVRYFTKYDFLPRATIIAPDQDAAGNPIDRTRTAPGKQTTVQWGPIVEIRLPLYARNELYVNGWYQMQSVRTRLYTEYPEEFRELFKEAERRPRRIQYPNIELTARFRF